MNNEQTKEPKQKKAKKKRLYSHATLLKELEKLEIIGHSDIARLLNWNSSKVATYLLRNALPDPLTEISGRPVWYKPDIIKTAKQNGWKIYEDNDQWEEKKKIKKDQVGA